MLQLRVTDDRGAVTQFVPERFPFKIGRSPEAHLRLDSAGVWDLHASVRLAENGRFVIDAEGESVILVGGGPVRSRELLIGDELALGATRVVVSLAPARQVSLRLHEAAVWALLLFVLALEVLVIAFAR